MIKTLLRAAAALAAAITLAMPAQATTYSTDFSDLWWNPSESGWGVNFMQQNDVIFATLFVYGVGNVAQWYTGEMRPSPSGSQATFSGQLFLTSGPYFGAPTFDPNAVTRTPVGTMTVNFTSATAGTLQYTVSGTQVTKTITRQTWAIDNLAGIYFGGLTAIGSNCSQTSQNGAVLIAGDLTVQQTGSQVSMNVKFIPPSGQESQCTFSGPFTQAGHLGSINGNWSCTTGNTGTFTLSSIDSGVNGFNGRFTGRDQLCTYDGFFGGPRDVPH